VDDIWEDQVEANDNEEQAEKNTKNYKSLTESGIYNLREKQLKEVTEILQIDSIKAHALLQFLKWVCTKHQKR